MSPGRKLIFGISIVCLFALFAMSIFSACDNRKSINPQVSGTQNLTMSLSPRSLVVHSETTPDTIEIDVRVRNTEGVGIDSIAVDLTRQPEIGTIVAPELTSNGGHINALFITDPGADQEEMVVFTATSGTDSEIDTLSMAYAFPTVSMSILPPELIVHSLNKSDTIYLEVRVRDADGNGIDSVEVTMSRQPELGTIIVDEVTTEGGLASGYYITDPGISSDTAIYISATAGNMVDLDTLNILVSLQGEIDTMNISLGKTSLLADGADNTTIYVSVIDTTGVPISDGTKVTIKKYGALYGGQLDSSTTQTENGLATFVLTAPSIIDSSVIIEVETILAYATSESGAVKEALATITYLPGNPVVLDITSNPVDMVAGSGTYQTISCTVYDANGNFVRNGTQIRYQNQLASSDITALTTTENGAAEAVYTVGTEAGFDEIRAFYNKPGSTDTLWSDAVSVHIASSFPTNIALTTTNPEIEVGGNATIVKATMQDENGNPLSEGYEIRFEITAAPSMIVHPNSPSFRYVPTVDSVCLETTEMTNVNGVASVTMFSGNRAGTVRIKATSVDDENIFKEKPLITIQSGPPYIIDIYQSNIAEAVEEAIVTGITAAIWDSFTNPVEPKTAVWFGLIPDSIGYIYGFAYTGGYQDEEDTTIIIGIPGQASTWMSYGCTHTFDTVRVVANAGELYDTSGAIVLALYDGEISLDANPGVLYVALDQTECSDITALLQDGLGCPIHNGVILFSASGCGYIDGQSIDTTDSDGYAYTEFCIDYNQIPEREPPLPPACDGRVIAKLRGYSDVEAEVIIFCTVDD